MTYRSGNRKVVLAVAMLMHAVTCWGEKLPVGPRMPQQAADGNSEMVYLPVVEGGEIRFDRLRRSQGLSHQRVTQIVQDDRGFMWFGTQFGLNRYDGYRFRTFKNDPDDPHSLCGVVISSLFVDRSGWLWVGCDYAVDRYDPVTETFIHYRLGTAVSPGVPGGVRHISQGPAGRLWLSTGNGLYRLDPDTGEITHISHDTEDPWSLASDDVKSSGTDRSGNFWVATNKGLDLLDRDHGRVTQHVPLTEGRDFSFYEDREGVFWLLYASGNGLAVLDKKTGRLTRYSFGRENSPTHPLTGVSSMLEDQDGTLWIGTFCDGLLKYDRDHHRFIRYRNDPSNSESLSEDRITTLFEDREGNVWLGFGATEPAFFATRPPPFEILPPDSGNPANLGERLVNAIYEDREGILWIGTTGSLMRLDRRDGRYTHVDIPGNGIASDVLSIVEDTSGALWLGTSGQGLYRRSPGGERLKGFRYVDTDAKSLSNDTVVALLVDHTGTLWASTLNGLDRFEPATQSFTVFHFIAGQADTYQHFMEDSNGTLWLGSYGNGLLRFDPASGRFSKLRSRAHGETLGDARINSLLIDHSGALWAGTQNGIDRFDVTTGWVAHYSEREGLAGIAVSCVLEDSAGALWFGTNAGLSRLDRLRRNFRNYSEADGLPGPDFTGWRACFRNSTGEMFIGGFSGAFTFRPESVVDGSYTPSVALTGFQLFGEPVALGRGSPLKRAIDYTDELTLAHDENSFSFEFSALSFRSPSTNRFRYKLDGLDENWHVVGSDRRYASYTTLPAGTYRFRVQGATSRGPWSEPGLAVRVRIHPAWWATWWSKALFGIVALLSIVLVYYVRIRQLQRNFLRLLKAREGERARIARNLHDSLLQGFQGLLFRLQAVRNLLPLRPADAARELETAMDIGDKAMHESRSAVGDLRVPASGQIDLVYSLTALEDELSLPEVPKYSVLVEGRPRDLAPLVRDEIFQIAREAVRNSLAHAQGQQIEVELIYRESEFRLRVRDDGVGFNLGIAEHRRLGHFGVQGMRERAESFGARFRIWSESGAGTEVELVVPARICYRREAHRAKP
jgi:ligand-binding sensor domain-containing protein/signal transduction histidine kinase